MSDTEVPTPVAERPVVFWDTDDGAEHLFCDSLDEAVSEFLSNVLLEDTPEEIEVFGFARVQVKPTPFLVSRLLEVVMEDLDEEHGSPDSPTEPTAEMQAAAEGFVAAVIAQYTAWRCEVVTRETVDLREWLAKEDEPIPAHLVRAAVPA